ncbi:MAG: bifunctional phosphopantothenoylcysteine decarboxylase/phosphopantothenate--cysteine ligase CoaBC [Gammaproteobacteria bacterium]
MKTLSNKRILLGVTGSIAAYKSAELVRRLREAGADVQVIMTQAATHFITELTMQAVSGKPVRAHVLDADEESGMGHIVLSRWADAVLIAPASANTIAKIAHGVADDLLSTICLASQVPLIVAPAMNQQMWLSAATQENVHTLGRRGVQVIGPGEGDQACGESGAGRMLEPTEIVHQTSMMFDEQLMTGLKVLVSAGPTIEDIDPVRFISNRSSGKMGYAIADAASKSGASVTLVTGPVSLPGPERVKRIEIRSADQMYDRVMEQAPRHDIYISAAAIADYRPVNYVEEKIKKNETTMTLSLEKTPDVVTRVANLDRGPFVVGFAAETRSMEQNALTKLQSKSLDMIVANSVGQKEIGFDSDENELTVYWRDSSKVLSRASKSELAGQLIKLIVESYEKNTAKST